LDILEYEAEGLIWFGEGNSVSPRMRGCILVGRTDVSLDAVSGYAVRSYRGPSWIRHRGRQPAGCWLFREDQRRVGGLAEIPNQGQGVEC
jgi:hypothetical protein